MKKIRRKDFYCINPCMLFSLNKAKYMADLYLPLIGPEAFAAYFSLQFDLAPASGSLNSHEVLLNSLKMSAGELERALSALEAVGLLKTYVSYGADASYFVYALLSPLSKEEFFADPLLYGTLRKYIGEEGISIIERKYAVRSTPTAGMEEVSESFNSFFSPDLNDPVYTLSSDKKGKRRAALKTEFEYDEFEKAIQEYGVDSDKFGKDDLEHIERIATLYGLDGFAAGEIAAECLGFRDGKTRFNSDKFDRDASSAAPFTYFRKPKTIKSEVSGSTKKAESIRVMDHFSPIEYLSMRQEGGKVSPSDEKIVRALSDMRLSNPVINAILAYCLERNHNALNFNYVTKVAASVAREGCKTSRETLEYLIGSLKKAAKKKTSTEGLGKSALSEERTVEIEEDEEYDEETLRYFEQIQLERKKRNG